MLLTPQLELFPPLNLQALYTWGRCQFSYKAFGMQFIIEIETQIQGNVQLQNIYIYIYIHEHYLPIFSSAIHNILQCIQDFIFNGCS